MRLRPVSAVDLPARRKEAGRGGSYVIGRSAKLLGINRGAGEDVGISVRSAMKTIALVCGLIAIVAAEEAAPYPPSGEKPPYPPSGWRPEGKQFSLPKSYGAPTETTPPQSYGPAEDGGEAQGTTEYPGEAEEENSRLSSERALPGQFFLFAPANGVLRPFRPEIEAEKSDVSNGENFGNADGTPERNVPFQKPEKLRIASSRESARQEEESKKEKKDMEKEEEEEKKKTEKAAPTAKGGAPSDAGSSGRYHLLLPNGRLQRVEYMNVIDPDRRVVSNVQYREVDPIPGPLYYGTPLVRVF